MTERRDLLRAPNVAGDAGDIATHADVLELVRAFYREAAIDDVLAPVLPSERSVPGVVVPMPRFPPEVRIILGVVVPPKLGVNSVKEVIALARARPGKLTAGAIPGGSQHLATEMLKISAGADFLYVPYKRNGPAMSDLLAGQLDFMFNSLQLVAPLARANRLRALAVNERQPIFRFQPNRTSTWSEGPR